MMRIQVRRSEKECTLKVEGEVEGMAAQELESLWRRQSCFGSETVIVDFSGVIHIDRKSRALLRSMYEKGVKFRGARMSIQDVLDEITAPGTFIDNDVQGT